MSKLNEPGDMSPSTMPGTIREDLLGYAKHLTCSERNAAYGDPLANFDLVVRLREAFWERCEMGRFTPFGHAIDMILLNLARIATAPTQEAALAKDRYADICGYAALAFEVGTRAGRS